MKKYQLRNIIRESIKELMNEQVNTSPNPNPCPPGGCAKVGVHVCGSSAGIISQYGTGGCTAAIFAHTGNNTQIGDMLTVQCNPSAFNLSNNQPNFNGMGYHSLYPSNTEVQAVVTQILSPTSGFSTPPPMKASWAPNLSTTSLGFSPTSDPCCNGQPYPACLSMSPVTPPSSGCDQSAWSNYNNWVNTWTNLGPFNSSNPNQPCNFICSKIQQWNNVLTNVGPVQANQLNCKLDVAQQQEQIHNCNC